LRLCEMSSSSCFSRQDAKSAKHLVYLIFSHPFGAAGPTLREVSSLPFSLAKTLRRQASSLSDFQSSLRLCEKPPLAATGRNVALDMAQELVIMIR